MAGARRQASLEFDGQFPRADPSSGDLDAVDGEHGDGVARAGVERAVAGDVDLLDRERAPGPQILQQGPRTSQRWQPGFP
jgi:hypothetical protein